MKFIVKTRDVDCSTRRAYRTREGAVKRFEEMLGYTFSSAVEEHYYAATSFPDPRDVKYVRGVSMFGTVVTFEALP